MYVVVRILVNMQSVEEAAARAKSGLGPLLRKTPGFQGYYVLRGGSGVGASLRLFETEQAALSANAEALSWIRQNIADLYEGEPEVIAGEVLVAVKP
jgi:hypothetical protein